MVYSASCGLALKPLSFAIAAIVFATAAPVRAADREGAVVEKRSGSHQQLRLCFHLPDGIKWPAGLLPEVYPEELREQVRLSWQPTNPRNLGSDPYTRGVRAVDSTTFVFDVAESKRPLYLAVFAPGFLRFFEVGPIRADLIPNAELEIPLPKPATLEMVFCASAPRGERLPFDRQMVSVMRMKSRNTYYWAAYRTELPLGKTVQISDLAPGEYRVSAFTHAKPNVPIVPGTEGRPVNPGRYSQDDVVTLAAGDTRRIDFHYAPPDLNAYRGQRTAIVHIVERDGRPASGLKVTIGYCDGHYSALPVFFGPVPQTGEIVLKGITDRLPTFPSMYRGYVVQMAKGQQDLGIFRFQTASGVESFTFRLPLEVGDLAPDIDIVNVATGEHKRLSSFRGKLVCLDFWTTWCEYCQETIQKLDRARAENRDHWNDRMTVLPVSLDEEPDSVARHLKQRGWNHLDHYWAGPWTVYPLDTASARAFGLESTPRSFLIGPDGRILWQGHPLAKVSGMDLIERIRETLKVASKAG